MILLITVPIVLVLFGVLLYNSIIAKKNDVENAFAGIDVQLKQRYDLIPGLVASVKHYMGHESQVLKEITRLRGLAVTQSLSANEKVKLDNQLMQSLGALNVTMEAYPAMKADRVIDNLQRSLNEVEAQLAAARRSYNAASTELNNVLQMFPSNILGAWMGLRPRELFFIEQVERENPNVSKLLAA